MLGHSWDPIYRTLHSKSRLPSVRLYENSVFSPLWMLEKKRICFQDQRQLFLEYVMYSYKKALLRKFPLHGKKFARGREARIVTK